MDVDLPGLEAPEDLTFMAFWCDCGVLFEAWLPPFRGRLRSAERTFFDCPRCGGVQKPLRAEPLELVANVGTNRQRIERAGFRRSPRTASSTTEGATMDQIRGIRPAFARGDRVSAMRLTDGGEIWDLCCAGRIERVEVCGDVCIYAITGPVTSHLHPESEVFLGVAIADEIDRRNNTS